MHNLGPLPKTPDEIDCIDPLVLQKGLYRRSLARIRERTQQSQTQKKDDLKQTVGHASIQLSTVEEGADSTVSSFKPLALGDTVEALARELVPDSNQPTVIVLSQYQTLPECRTFTIQLLRTLRHLNPSRPIACALDHIPNKDQHLLDAFIKGELAAGDLNQSLGLSEEMGIRYWHSLLPLLYLGESSSDASATSKPGETPSRVPGKTPCKIIELLAADWDKNHQVTHQVKKEKHSSRTASKIHPEQRENVTTQVVSSWLNKNPAGIVLIVAGEQRLLDGYLYEKLAALKIGPPKIILQAWEAAYWQLAQHPETLTFSGSDPEPSLSFSKLRQKALDCPCIRWRENLYTVTPVPPLVKLDSFLTWTHHQEDWPGWPPDLAAQKMRRHIRNQLDLPYSQDHATVWNDPTIYALADLELLERMKNQDGIDKETAFRLLQQIIQEESYYLPEPHWIYLASLSTEHLGEEIGHSIRIGLTKEKPHEFEWTAEDMTYYVAINEAAGYLASKIIAPSRQSAKSHQKKFHALLRNLQLAPGNSLKVDGVEDINRVGHQAGYGLGENIYQDLKTGHLEAEAIHALFDEPLSSGRAAKKLFQNLSELLRLPATLAPGKARISDRIPAVAMFYVALFFLPALLWSQARELLAFPKPFSANWLRDGLIVFSATAGVVGLSWLLQKFSKAFQHLTQVFQDLLGPLNYEQMILLAAFSSLGEEMLFRGAIQGELVQALGPVAGISVSSILFGVVHFVPDRRFLPWTLFATLAGFLLGGCYYITGNLMVPVMIHFLINFANMALLLRK